MRKKELKHSKSGVSRATLKKLKLNTARAFEIAKSQQTRRRRKQINAILGKDSRKH